MAKKEKETEETSKGDWAMLDQMSDRQLATAIGGFFAGGVDGRWQDVRAAVYHSLEGIILEDDDRAEVARIAAHAAARRLAEHYYASEAAHSPESVARRLARAQQLI